MRGFTTEWNAEQKGRGVEQESKRDELKRLSRKIANLVSAVAESGGSSAILSVLKEAETRQRIWRPRWPSSKRPRRG